MKILEISTISLIRNGISTFVISTYNYFKKRGYNINVLVPEYAEPKIISENNMQNDCFVIKNRNTNPVSYFLKLIHFIKINQYDIVHVHGNSCTMTIELLAAKVAGCKIRIAHSHNTTCEHMFLNHILRFLFEFSCTYRVACSKEAGEWLFKNKKFIVLRNGIELSKYLFSCETRNKYRNILNITSHDILLGNIAFFNYQKNQEYLIDVLVALLKENIHYKLLLIGDGDLKCSVQNKVINCDLFDKVIFLDSVNNVQDYMQAIDIFVLPSRFEGFPYVLVEAQASGLNCVVNSAIDKKVNLTGNVYFASIDDVNEWVFAINKSEMLSEKREEVSVLANKCLSKQGFNLNDSLLILEKKYIDLYSKYRVK